MITRFVPHQHLTSVFELNLDELREQGIRGLIFDLDNTLGAWGFKTWDEHILAWLGEVETLGFRLAFLSNDEGIDRDAVRTELNGHPLRFNAGKPSAAGFREMLAALDLAASEVAMIGDQIFTDVLGARRVGLYTVLVRPFDPDTETSATRVRRWLERGILRLSGQWRHPSSAPTLERRQPLPKEDGPE